MLGLTFDALKLQHNLLLCLGLLVGSVLQNQHASLLLVETEFALATQRNLGPVMLLLDAHQYFIISLTRRDVNAMV